MDRSREVARTARHALCRGRPRRGRGFGEDKVFVRARDLSGGEKARLNFALITHEAPPLLILDEPTNHLDIEAREALVSALNDFSGAVVIISHDWHLLSLTADRLWLVAEGTARPWQGDLEDYRRCLLETRPAEESDERPAGGAKREARRAAAERRQALTPLRRALREAEQRMTELARRKAELDRHLADPLTYAAEGAALQQLLRERNMIAEALADAESRWLAVAESLEQAES